MSRQDSIRLPASRFLVDAAKTRLLVIFFEILLGMSSDQNGSQRSSTPKKFVGTKTLKNLKSDITLCAGEKRFF